MPPSLSIAMIVRDEEATLGECLESINAFADEVCLIDTGSTDASVEIARAAGVQAETFQWCDDFSAARNASLKCCQGDWILVLDADERIALEDQSRLRDLLRAPPDRCYRFQTRNYSNDRGLAEFYSCTPRDRHSDGFCGWFPSHKIRLFPNRQGIEFQFKVHELVDASIAAAKLEILESGIPVHHYPLKKDSGRLNQKLQLYLRLGEAKIEEAPDNPQGHAELGNQHAEMGAYGKAAASYRDCLRLAPENPSVLKDLGTMLLLLGLHAQAEKALRLAVTQDPRLADGWRNLGVLYGGSERWEKALECFEAAVNLRAGWSEGLRHLAVALENVGRLDEAVAKAFEAVQRDPASSEALSLYVHQMKERNRSEEAKRRLTEIVDELGPLPAVTKVIEDL